MGVSLEDSFRSDDINAPYLGTELPSLPSVCMSTTYYFYLTLVFIHCYLHKVLSLISYLSLITYLPVGMNFIHTEYIEIKQ